VVQQNMPPPPPVALPDQSALAGTLPASVLQQMSMMGAGVATKRSDPPPLLDRTQPTAAPAITQERAAPKLPPRSNIGGSTEYRTLDTGAARSNAPKTVDDLPSKTTTGPKTIIDDVAPLTRSQSTVRTPRPLTGFLVSFQYEPLGTYWPLGMGPNLVGRTGGGRPDLDVGIGDTTVSTEQAIVEVETRGNHELVAIVEDRSSRNGTCINGQPLAAGHRYPVGHGDRIRFGSFETVLVLVPYAGAS
jgi:hypothetical protein